MAKASEEQSKLSPRSRSRLLVSSNEKLGPIVMSPLNFSMARGHIVGCCSHITLVSKVLGKEGFGFRISKGAQAKAQTWSHSSGEKLKDSIPL
eukprot:874962-Rhodomonas_salina.2